MQRKRTRAEYEGDGSEDRSSGMLSPRDRRRLRLGGGGKGASFGQSKQLAAMYNIRNLRSMRTLELKSCDRYEAGGGISTSATFIILNQNMADTPFYNFIGSEIQMKSAYIAGQIFVSNPPVDSKLSDYIRVMLVYDRQANGALFTKPDLLESANINGVTDNTVLAFRKVGTKDRFLVLADKRISFPGTNTDIGPVGGPWKQEVGAVVDYSKNPVNFKIFVPLGGLVTRYNGDDSGTISDIETGSLVLFILGKNPPATSNFSYRIVTRLVYTD